MRRNESLLDGRTETRRAVTDNAVYGRCETRKSREFAGLGKHEGDFLDYGGWRQARGSSS
jgi:hypothetical protein